MIASISVARHQAYLIKDYYNNDLEQKEGVWIGQGAATLGLDGKVNQEEFGRLWHGYAPDGSGQKLVQNAGSENRRAGYDITFSAPKSVSIAWGIGSDEARARIEHAHHIAVLDAHRYLEENATVTRRGKGGAVHEQAAGLVTASFQHGTSRDNDVQLHTHTLNLNLVQRTDGSYGAIESSYLYDHKMAAGSVYQTSLSTQIQRCGFKVWRDEKGWGIKGIPDQAVDHFSKRSREINESIKQNNLEPTAKNKEQAALKTRSSKSKVTFSELQNQWKKDAARFGVTPESIEAIRKKQPPPPLLELSVFERRQVEKKVLASALSDCTRQKTVFSKKELDTAIAKNSIGQGFVYNDIKGVREQFFKSNNAIELKAKNTSVAATKGNRFFTTKEQINFEAELCNAVDDRAGDKSYSVKSKALFTALSSRESMTKEQSQALKHVTAPGGVAVVSGMAGTGKTYMLSAAREVWEDSGYKVKGVALSGKAASGLQDGAGIKSSTIDSLFYSIDKQKQACDRRGQAGGRWPSVLDEKTMLVVDEAAMVDNPRMAILFREAQTSKAKLVLVGDGRQIQPVDQGGAFQTIEGQIGSAKLTKIIRQEEEWQRKAVHNFADAKAHTGLAAYDARGLITVVSGKEKLHANLIDQWAAGGGVSRPADNPIIAIRNEDVDALNRLAQQKRKEAGVLGDRWGIINGKKIYEQDRVQFLQNNRKLGVLNGLGGVVEKIDHIKNSVSVSLDNGNQTSFSTDRYSKISLAYASTTHKAQGTTVENTHILAGSSMQNRELSYVQMSRHKQSARIYVEGNDRSRAIDGLAKKMNRQNQKTFASSWQMLEKQKNNAVAHVGQSVRAQKVSL